ncbi:hypothetical protein AGMMS49579_02300 [Spirochaetia bacterium]|nr:hypothetical protein AGMMS49579_01970 [Spirochaetia bacterium]GHV49773.1 hypothetical protein AGMMS49579_02300 [Spirochaetia bacterium]
MKKAFVSAVLALLFLSCGTTGPAATGKAPLWVTNPQDAYPDSDWLCVVETGRDRITAENAALNALAQTFRLDVQGITRANQVLVSKVQQSRGKENSDAERIGTLAMEITTVSEVSGLIGVQRDFWTDSRSGQVYASARMQRAEGAARYGALIQENEKLIETLKASAKRTSGTFAAYENLSLAAGVAELTDNFYVILGVLSPGTVIQRPAYGNAEAIRSSLREEAALIVIQVRVAGDVDSRLSKAFASVFSKRGFKTSAALSAASGGYTLSADFKMEDAPVTDSRYQYTRFVLTASLTDKDGAALLSFSETNREGHVTQNEARQRAIRSAETLITEGEFVREFDAYLGSL